MTFPERFSNLPEYAFPRLRTLLDAHAPGGEVIHMSIGEPRHEFPDWVIRIVNENAEGFGRYPPNEGSPGLRAAISDWILRRYGVVTDPDTQIMALNGTREGLFNAALALCPEEVRSRRPVILMPNPFYQVYAVAALAVGAKPVYVPAGSDTGFLPDYGALNAETLDSVAIAYICSPSNPQGAVADRSYWEKLIGLAERHDFKIFADECYSEIYRGEPPVGALEVAREMAAHPERVTIFNSLSKRSNLPGLRSGFMAGGPESLTLMKQLRAYAGAPLPLPLQAVAEEIWADEAHVARNRDAYRRKYAIADDIFGDVPGYFPPSAGFFLWLPADDGEQAALKLWKETGVRVLPGAYLAREVGGDNPGKGYIRVAMVAPMQEMQHGLRQIRDCLYS